MPSSRGVKSTRGDASVQSKSTHTNNGGLAGQSRKDDGPTTHDVESSQPAQTATRDEAELNYKPKTIKFWLVILSSVAAMFLVALDRTILSTAIPRITDDFGSIDDIGWYGAAYMLTSAAFQLTYGRIYRVYDLRWTFLTCILVFELGSALCGAAPTTSVFIVGRSIAGVASAGITTGSLLIVIPLVPLRKRPMFQSMSSLVFGISSVAGPLIGGAFAERATWRWCFYMNLPIGALVFVFLFFCLETSKPQQSATTKEKIRRLDPVGTLLFVPSMSCLILALQWGGSTYPWINWRIILLFVLCGLSTFGFAVVQIKTPETASLPPRIIMRRSILAGVFFMLFLSGGMLMSVYYIPLWFQTTHGINPLESGIYTIPLVLSLVLAGVISAAVTQRTGYYVPSMIGCSCITAVGQGLMTTFTPSSGPSSWVTYQFLTGFGIGFGMQAVSLAAQATLDSEDVPTGLAVNLFSQQLGGAIFVPVGQAVLNASLLSELSDIPGLDVEAIRKNGATGIRQVVSSEYLGNVDDAYNYACTRIFLSGSALAIAQFVCALCMKWVNIREVQRVGRKREPKE